MTDKQPASLPGGDNAEPKLQSGAHLFNLAQGVKDVSLPLLLVVETGRAADVGIAFAVQQLPNLLLSPAAGLLVDRVDRRTVLWVVTATRVVLALMLVAIAATGFDLVLVCVVLFFLGVGDAVYDIALISYTADAVDAKRLPVLNGRFASSEILFTRVVGAVVGGAVFSWLGTGVFGLAAATWLLSAIAFFLLPRRVLTRRLAPTKIRLHDGFVLVWRDPVLRGLALGSVVLNLSVSAWWVLIPLASVGVHGLPLAAYGLVMAGVGLGAVAATWTGHRLERLSSPLPLLVASVLVVALGGFTMGLAGNIWLFLTGLLMFTVADAIWTVWSATVRQRRIPHEQLGIANGAYRSIGRGASPLGSLLGGFVAQGQGVALPFEATAAMLLATALGVALFWRWKGSRCALD